jgi:hypothetical protein
MQFKKNLLNSEGRKRPPPNFCDSLVGASYEGVTKLHFCEEGVKTRAINYQSDILQKEVKPLSNTVFAGRQWIIQQTSVHKAKSTQRWLDTILTEFIASEDRSPVSPNLNPLDYCL